MIMLQKKKNLIGTEFKITSEHIPLNGATVTTIKYVFVTLYNTDGMIIVL